MNRGYKMHLDSARFILNSTQFRNYSSKQRRSAVSKLLADGVTERDLFIILEEMRIINHNVVHMFYMRMGGDIYLRYNDVTIDVTIDVTNTEDDMKD